MAEQHDIDSMNPYRPPESPPMLTVVGGRFDCPQCETALPFTRIWLMQPIGRCPICRTRLVVRRPGWHKLWSPVLMLLCGVFCFSLATLIGVTAILFVPLVLCLLATIDGLIAFRLGYFDRPRWIL